MISKRTNSVKPDERIEGILPPLEFLPVNKPCASCWLPQLAGVIMVRRGVRCSQPLVDLLPVVVCSETYFVKLFRQSDCVFTSDIVF